LYVDILTKNYYLRPHKTSSFYLATDIHQICSATLSKFIIKTHYRCVLLKLCFSFSQRLLYQTNHPQSPTQRRAH
jgi:hypothetical protein